MDRATYIQLDRIEQKLDLILKAIYPDEENENKELPSGFKRTD